MYRFRNSSLMPTTGFALSDIDARASRRAVRVATVMTALIAAAAVGSLSIFRLDFNFEDPHIDWRLSDADVNNVLSFALS